MELQKAVRGRTSLGREGNVVMGRVKAFGKSKMEKF